MSKLEDKLAGYILTCDFPKPDREYRFCERRWKFDFAWPEYMLALEVEGGIYTNGRHTRGSGFEGDIEKYNRAVCEGWRVLRCTAKTIKNGLILNDLEACLYGDVKS